MAAATVMFAAFGGGNGNGNVGGNTPEKITESFYTEIQNENFEKAAEILLKNQQDYLWETIVEKKKIPQEIVALGISHYANELREYFKNGFKSFEIISDEDSEGFKRWRHIHIKYIDNNGHERSDYLDFDIPSDFSDTDKYFWGMKHSVNG